jgi:hypothetical protein
MRGIESLPVFLLLTEGSNHQRPMRKIERQMIQAIIERKNWKNANTEVRILDRGEKGKSALVLLHNNPIAQYDEDGSMQIQHCGWLTTTTKSRLNVFLRNLGRHTYGIKQCAHSWYLTDTNGERPMIQDWWYTVA